MSLLDEDLEIQSEKVLMEKFPKEYWLGKIKYLFSKLTAPFKCRKLK